MVALDGDEVPALLVAVTLNVYAVDEVSPVTVTEPFPDCSNIPVTVPGVDVAV